ncbi:MAG: terminase [Ruminococcus sp.]|nr:terminase [Ruminococcus sp.]
MSDEERIGRQFPTQSVVLPYNDTRGGEALLLYDQSSRKTMPWQQAMMYDIMAVGEDGLWRHIKFGWSIPRRNGKSELLIMRSIWGLLHSQAVLYTAHLVNTSTSAFLKITRLLSEMGYIEGDNVKFNRQKGGEKIEMLDGSGGHINFRTRTSTGGLGEGYDLLIIDEAQEYTADQETALQYVVTDSKNPQTLMCGTPPTAVSKGTVFYNYRRDVLTGRTQDNGWAEWGVAKKSDVENTDLWYEMNPSLGLILSERSVRAENRKDEVDYNIQRLGLWLTYNQKSAISREEWRALIQTPERPAAARIFFGVKFARASENVSLAAAVKLSGGKIFVEVIDCRPVREGVEWLLPFFKNPHAEAVVIDGANGQTMLADSIKDAGITKLKVTLPKVAEIIEANAMFEQAVLTGTLCHSGQPSLEQAVANCEHRAIGSNGGFGYTSMLEGADITLVEAVALAHCACAKARKKFIQRGYA